MWIFTAGGVFFPSARPAKTIPAGDDRTLQLRSRRKEYLDWLNVNYLGGTGEVLSGMQVRGTAMDYPWRMYLTTDQFAGVMRQIATEIVDDQMLKFKPYTESKRGLKGRNGRKLAARLHSTYTHVWGTLLSDLSDGTSSYDWPAPATVRRAAAGTGRAAARAARRTAELAEEATLWPDERDAFPWSSAYAADREPEA